MADRRRVGCFAGMEATEVEGAGNIAGCLVVSWRGQILPVGNQQGTNGFPRMRGREGGASSDNGWKQLQLHLHQQQHQHHLHQPQTLPFLGHSARFGAAATATEPPGTEISGENSLSRAKGGLHCQKEMSWCCCYCCCCCCCCCCDSLKSSSVK